MYAEIVTLHPPPTDLLASVTANQLYYIISGQHTFSELLRREHEQANLEIPEVFTKYTAKVVHSDTDLATRRLIAGREQARQLTVHPFKLSQRLKTYWELYKADEATGDTDRMRTRRPALLRETYRCTSGTRQADGDVVWSVLCRISPSLYHLVESQSRVVCVYTQS